MRGTFDEVKRDRERAAAAKRKQDISDLRAEIKGLEKLISRGRTDLNNYLADRRKKLESLE
jgi:hypothetical protein